MMLKINCYMFCFNFGISAQKKKKITKELKVDTDVVPAKNTLMLKSTPTKVLTKTLTKMIVRDI